MKKVVMVVALAAVFGIPLFAQNKVGKVTGVQVQENQVVVNIAEGLINPFEEGGFTKSGDSSVTVPLDLAVEFYFPMMGRRPEGKQPEDKKAGTASQADESKTPEFPKLEVKNLKIDQMVQVVYAEDGKTVEKIQTLPMMMGARFPMAKAFPGKPGDNRFGFGDKTDGEFSARGKDSDRGRNKDKTSSRSSNQRNWR